jgi:hypothetical protein
MLGLYLIQATSDEVVLAKAGTQHVAGFCGFPLPATSMRACGDKVRGNDDRTLIQCFLKIMR